MSEPFDWKKFLSTRLPTSGEQWAKWLDLAWKLAVMFCIGLAIYNLFFKKPQSNVNQPDSTQRVMVLPGAKVDKVMQTTVQKNEQKAEVSKRPWFQPIPFVSAGVFAQHDGDTQAGLKAEAGLRIDLG
jgi:hypothetical protein